MTKILLLTTLVFFTFNHSHACNKKIDNSKVVLFVDLNASYPEVIAAKEAACARGEDFVVLPGGEKNSKDLFNLYGEMDKIDKKIQNKKCNYSNPSAECSNLGKQYQDARNVYNKKKNESPFMDKKLINSAIKNLANNNTAITSAVFSGHDGGGTISGETGHINKHDFMQSFNQAYGNKPALKNQFESLFLGGCFTSTPDEVLQWKTGLPHLKIIGGFHGIGPSNRTRAAQTVMKDFLVKSKLMCETCNETKLKGLITGLADINYTAAGIYVQTKCQKDEYYYYKEKNQSNGGLTSKFSRFENAINCGNPSTMNMLRNNLYKYDSGEIAIPVITTGTELRSIYSTARQMAQCIDAKDSINPNRVGLLLFYNDVQKNFAKVFAPSMIKGQDVLNTKADAALKSAKAKYLGTTQSLGDWWNEREYLADIMSDFDKRLQKAKKSIGPAGIKDIHKMNRAQLTKTLSELDPVLNHNLHKRIPEVKKELAPLLKAKKEIETYLLKLDPSCMDFLDWHEVKAGHTPAALCKY